MRTPLNHQARRFATDHLLTSVLRWAPAHQGLVTPVPAWLVASLGLLGTPPGAKPHLISAAARVLSAATALVGTIAIDTRIRGAGESVQALHTPRLCRLNLLVLLPAWVIALVGHVAPR